MVYSLWVLSVHHILFIHIFRAVCICAGFGEVVVKWSIILLLIHNYNGRISRQTMAVFSTKKTCLVVLPHPVFPPSLWRIAPRGSIMWVCGLLNGSYKKDQVKFKCLLFDIPKSVWLTFGFPEACDRLHDVLCSCFSHFQPFYRRCQTFAWLWNLESWKLKEVSGWQHNKQEPVLSEVLLPISFSRTFCLPLSLSKIKLLIHLGLLRCRGVRENIFMSSSYHWLYTNGVQKVN